MLGESDKLKEIIARLESTEAQLTKIESGRMSCLQTKKLELVDKDGRVRACIGLSDEGSPGLWLTDEAGQLRVAVELNHDFGDGVRIYDRYGKQRVILNCHEMSSAASLYLLGADGFRSPGISLHGDDSPYMSINDPNTGLGVIAALARDTGPYVEVYGKDGGAALGAATDKEYSSGEDMELPSTAVTSFDSECRVLWKKP